MKSIRLLSTAALVLMSTSVLVATDPAQRGTGQAAPVYNVATEVTLSGTIEDVKVIPGPGAQGGIHLALKTASEAIQVDLGPEWFLTQQKYVLAKGDAVTVIGSRVKAGANDVVIAREIKKGDQTMTFRDAKGIPKWSGRGRG